MKSHRDDSQADTSSGALYQIAEQTQQVGMWPLRPRPPPPPLPPPTPPPPAKLTNIAGTMATQQAIERRRPKPGILRLDMSKPRRSSGGSVEFRTQPQMLGEDITSPTGVQSPHQLTVTWATSCDIGDASTKHHHKSTPSGFDQTPPPGSVGGVHEYLNRRTPIIQHQQQQQEYKPYDHWGGSNLVSPTDTIDFPLHPLIVGQGPNSNCKRYTFNEDNGHGINGDNDKQTVDDEDEDYSISVSAIMQRRASVRGYRNKRSSRNSRRASSPMDHVLDNAERRRSSVYTTSSDEGTNQESTQEQIFENIRLHKEVIQSVKLQPWPMRKKLKLVRQAKTYVARHEGALQERFAMSRSTRDLWARFKILMAARWRHWKRETTSFLTVLIPWELRIKEIESHFGSGVASYFTFLRWLMWVNIMIAIPLVAFVIGPEYFATKHDETDPRKKMSEQEFKVAGNLFTFWEFEGYLKYSPMFYGYYSSFSGASALGYKLPLAYFLTAVVVYIYSFVATLRKMAENSRNSKLSSKDDECTFSWKLFTGWDFMIGHAETAHNRIASVVVGFKEALLEEAEKKKDNRNWRIILQRILVNILVMGLLAASGYTVVFLVNNAEKLARQDNWLSRNAVNVTMTLLSFFLPMIFEALGLFENWHPRQQLRLQLARIMILNMLNLYSLMFSFIYNINSKDIPLQLLKEKNETATKELVELTGFIESMKATALALKAAAATSTAFPTTTTSLFDLTTSTLEDTTMGDGLASTTESVLTSTFAAATTLLTTTIGRVKCYNITVKCSKLSRINNRTTTLSTAIMLMNLTTTMMPMNLTDTTGMPITMSTGEDFLSTTITTLPTETTTTTENYTNLWTTMTEPNTDGNTMLTTTKTTSTQKPRETTTLEPITSTIMPTTTTTMAPPTTTTASMSSSRDSYFYYYDYFAGMPVDEPLDEDNVVAEQLDEQENQKSSRSRRQVEQESPVTGQPQLTIRPLLKSKYSHRREGSGKLPEDPLLVPTTTPTTVQTTTTVTTPTEPTESNSRATIWEPNPKLHQLLAYFTTSTSTIAPGQHTTTNPTTEMPSDDTSAATTLAFIDDQEIADISDTNYYYVSDLDEEDFDWCVRRICEELPADWYDGSSTTTMDSGDGPTTQMTAVDVSTVAATPLELKQRRLLEVRQTLKEVQKNLTSMCWETSLGQELSKVIVFDGIMSIVAPLCIDFLRALFVRYVNQHWCWDMEKTFPQYGDFKIAENILTLINNQGQVWMGIFFSPGLVLINLVKLIIMMYFRSWIVLTCNVPHEVVFKASKSNNFYLSLLLTMLFLCVLPVGYAIVWLRPSWHCGPFSDYDRISKFITTTTRNALPEQLHKPLNYLTSSSTVIPLLLLLILIIYYLVSLTGALREANQDLRTQLQKEREEERKKIFKVAETKPPEQNPSTLTSRWRKVLEASSPVTPTQPPDFETEEYKSQARKELISRIMKEALRKGSATSDDDSVVRRDDDDTDTEHHDSLPLDEENKEKRFGLSKLQQIRRTRKPSLVDIVQIAKSERERSQQRGGGGAGGGSVTETAHSRRSFKVDKSRDSMKKSPAAAAAATAVPQPPPAVDNDNDPEINSRIVNERRQSLLRRKRDDEPSRTEKPIASQETKDPAETDTPVGVSKFEVVDEKKTPPSSKADSSALPPSTGHTHHLPHVEGLKFKFKKIKSKSHMASNEPEIFKFDQPHDQEDQASKELPSAAAIEHLSAESQPPKNSEDLIVTTTPTGTATPPHTPTSAKQLNAEKLASLSRQGRKKIGSLLALVREAVNTKRGEGETKPNFNGNGQISPALSTPTSATASTSSRQLSLTGGTEALQMDVDSGLPPPPPPSTEEVDFSPTADLSDSIPLPPPPVVSTPPVAPQVAPLETAEELDQHGPITFPMRTASHRRRCLADRPIPMPRQDSQTSVWSDNIPTITISAIGSDECIAETVEGPANTTAVTPTTTATTSNTNVASVSHASSPTPVVNIIQIRIEDEN